MIQAARHYVGWLFLGADTGQKKIVESALSGPHL